MDTGLIVRQAGGSAGSVADHIPWLIAHARTRAPSGLVQEIKTESSK